MSHPAERGWSCFWFRSKTARKPLVRSYGEFHESRADLGSAQLQFSGSFSDGNPTEVLSKAWDADAARPPRQSAVYSAISIIGTATCFIHFQDLSSSRWNNIRWSLRQRFMRKMHALRTHVCSLGPCEHLRKVSANLSSLAVLLGKADSTEAGSQWVWAPFKQEPLMLLRRGTDAARAWTMDSCSCYRSACCEVEVSLPSLPSLSVA